MTTPPPYALVSDLSEAPEPPTHVITERDDFERRVRVTYCRRCGRPIVNDRYPDKVTVRNCEAVQIALRASTSSAPCRGGCGTTENLLRGWCAGCVQDSASPLSTDSAPTEPGGAS